MSHPEALLLGERRMGAEGSKPWIPETRAAGPDGFLSLAAATDESGEMKQGSTQLDLLLSKVTGSWKDKGRHRTQLRKET